MPCNQLSLLLRTSGVPILSGKLASKSVASSEPTVSSVSESCSCEALRRDLRNPWRQMPGGGSPCYAPRVTSPADLESVCINAALALLETVLQSTRRISVRLTSSGLLSGTGFCELWSGRKLRVKPLTDANSSKLVKRGKSNCSNSILPLLSCLVKVPPRG